MRELRLEGADEIFTAALLHDMGKMILGQFVQADYAQIERALAQGLPFETAEAIAFGTNHAEIGAEVLTKWSLPARIVNAVRWHHRPEKSETDRFDSRRCARRQPALPMIGIGVGRDGLHYQPSPEVTRGWG